MPLKIHTYPKDKIVASDLRGDIIYYETDKTTIISTVKIFNLPFTNKLTQLARVTVVPESPMQRYIDAMELGRS